MALRIQRYSLAGQFYGNKAIGRPVEPHSHVCAVNLKVGRGVVVEAVAPVDDAVGFAIYGAARHARREGRVQRRDGLAGAVERAALMIHVGPTAPEDPRLRQVR